MDEFTFTLSQSAIEAMNGAGWKYYAHRKGFERDYYRCNDASVVARDISDFTGYKVVDYDTSVDEGYWYVSLTNDDECYYFARKYNEYYDMRQRISHALFNGVLLITKEQYKQIVDLARDYDKRFVGDYVMIAIPNDATTRHIIAILDALGM
jgi:hypothetical protein